MVTPFIAVAAALLASLFLASDGAAQHYSELWGERGELWEPGRPLNDFSDQAGYRGGTVPLPRREVRVSVKDFGAIGDGEADDTQAIIDAIEACPEGGAVFIPIGRYKITDWIRIENLENVTIRGENMFETELWFPLGLEDIHSAPTRTTGNIPTTRYSWGGGFFWFDDAEELGIENFSFIFPDRPYEEHFKERGYNMIRLDGTNCWTKNVRGYNAVSGIRAAEAAAAEQLEWRDAM
ncbi:glycosyl hydrolase family 28-related protein [Novipirellula artificiosorum]|nr:glycosyl hydrolase family 28-related protein [Novipirellula artificiosorum]